MASGRVEPHDPKVVAAQLWSFVHGYITLELAEHFVEFDDPVGQVLLPMGVTFAVGLGDTSERAEASHEAGRAPVRLGPARFGQLGGRLSRDRGTPARSRCWGSEPSRLEVAGAGALPSSYNEVTVAA